MRVKGDNMGKLLWVDARRRAQQVLDEYWDLRFPVDVEQIARQLNVDTMVAPLSDDFSGLIVKTKDKKAVAVAQAKEPETRRRFTFAHELGHFVDRTQLADDHEFSFIDTRMPDHYDLHEFYADEFAGALLMPEDEVARLQNAGTDLTTMARHFGVSRQAVSKRVERLRRNATPAIHA